LQALCLDAGSSEGDLVLGTKILERRFFTNGCPLGVTIMTDRKTRLSDDQPDTSWIWIGASLAAIFLVLGLFAILWGGNAPTGSATMSPVAERPITPRTLGEPVTQEPAPGTTGQRSR